MNRGGFSWQRLVGISALKARISRFTGVPLSRSGREQKIGRFVMGWGCLVLFAVVFALVLAVQALFRRWF